MAGAGPYRGLSRFTDPGGGPALLDELPGDVTGICEVARKQTIHHNLLVYYGVPRRQWPLMRRVWPPRLPDALRALRQTPPHHLSSGRLPGQRVIGACVLESHLLAGLLRHRGFAARVRAGYFAGIRGNGAHVVRFWEQLGREKDAVADLTEAGAQEWREQNNAFTRQQNQIDHHIEHWVCEYWDDGSRRWRILDANTDFLKAHSDITTGFHLPAVHFEYAHQAWRQMRHGDGFHPDRYREDPQDGRSHIRSQLLSDFFSLLRHDLAGTGEPTGRSRAFIKEQAYEQTPEQELRQLDLLAELLALDPPAEQLTAFYQRSVPLRLQSAETDRYSLVFRP
jgi:hypothetical protein